MIIVRVMSPDSPDDNALRKLFGCHGKKTSWNENEDHIMIWGSSNHRMISIADVRVMRTDCPYDMLSGNTAKYNQPWPNGRGFKHTSYLSFFLHSHIFCPENFTLKSAWIYDKKGLATKQRKFAPQIASHKLPSQRTNQHIYKHLYKSA